ncbi:GspE/PulE family protein [Clostridium saccharobutylicum]|nr:GspE/PulE family protein [Clostridium saccharobutylicum]MBA8791633.1 type IV pilus assembly protein PilB [Clostridium saccharobutylicum]MBA8995859.1 type IV pilus assembly protein PilB [Clostridium saccharobutylicum]MBC2403397.1 type II/IV secretion system protein [Clostridium saccharobutylicum]MBC2414291.1 type II/IV secretion system protein [Clostridium saccharobutylicum]MBC2441846.1 type II/IV secretion system protein [Clostridium saccharobutylicum]
MCETYKIIPISDRETEVIVLACDIKNGADEYLEFIYNKKINLQSIEEKNYEKLKEIIFGIEDRNLEKTLIFNAIKSKASDIHFEPHKTYVDIRYRINGSLILVHKMEIREYATLVSKIKLNSNMDITEKRRPQDGKIIVNYNNAKYDLRVSSIPLVYGEKLVIRILYCDNFNYKLEDLGFSYDEIEIIRKIISMNNGLVIVNGPTGAGKSTTLYTILREIDSRVLNITTLEDPVEVVMDNVNQMSLNRKLDIDFSTGLRSILRQDPDVIMLGEIRDEETAAMAVRASITGHKVYSTIHCKSARDVYLRLENMGIKPYLIDDALIGIISQRLVKILCSKCKVKDKQNSFNGMTVYKKCGCKSCNYSGYEGRKVVSSVYFLQDENKKKIKELYEDSSYLSNKNMKCDLEKLLAGGKIQYQDYLEFIEGERLSE